MLQQVFPSEIPVKYLDKVVVTKKDGTITEIDSSNIEGNIPLDPKNASPLSKIWNQETKKVEIYLNLSKVEEAVLTSVEQLFKDADLD